MMKSCVLTLTLLSLSLVACASRQGVPSTATPSQPKFTLDQAGPRPSRVEVNKGDTVYSIAYKYGVASRSIIAANNLHPPYTLEPGQELELPAPQEHVVIEGENAQGIAAFYGVDVKVLARENRLDADFKVQPGDRLFIPAKDTVAFAQEDDGSSIQSAPIATSSLAPLDMEEGQVRPQGQYHTFDVAAEISRERMGKLDIQSELQREIQGEQQTLAVTPVATPIEPVQGQSEKQAKDEDSRDIVPVPPVKAVAVGTAGAATSAPTVPVNKSPSVPAAAPSSAYIWPAKGEVIAKFGQTVNGAKNDGLNIALPAGSPVYSAAAGDVVYSGNALKGFGNLVLVKHNDGYMSAYGHNSKLLVKKGDKVIQGQKIAESGSTGDVKSPQLHFELRKGTQPIDPTTKLGS